jgi:hypothetical protein
MRDGDIDYAAYTVRELEEALAGIDRRRYPRTMQTFAPLTSD